LDFFSGKPGFFETISVNRATYFGN